MKGPPRAPSIRMLSDAQLDALQSFIEKHELEIELGKQKSLSFLYTLYKKEDAKRAKKEKYSKKLLKDAENLILSMQSIPPGSGTRPSEPPPAYAQAKPAGKIKDRKLLEIEELASSSKEERIRRKLAELFNQDEKSLEKMVKALLENKEGEKLAARISSLFIQIKEQEHNTKLHDLLLSGTSYIYIPDLAGACEELGSIFEGIGLMDFAGEIYSLQADALREKEPEKASEIYKKSAGLLIEGRNPDSAAKAYGNSMSLFPAGKEKILETLYSEVGNSENANNYQRAANLCFTLAYLLEGDSAKHAELEAKAGDYSMKCGEYRDAAVAYKDVAATFSNQLSDMSMLRDNARERHANMELSAKIVAFNIKSAEAFEEAAKATASPAGNKMDLLNAAERYWAAVFATLDKTEKEQLCEKAGNLFPQAGRYAEAAEAYSRLADLLGSKNPIKALEANENAVQNYFKAENYEKINSRYYSIDSLVRGKDREEVQKHREAMAAKLAAKAEEHAKAGDYIKAGYAYTTAAQLICSTLETGPLPAKLLKASGLYEKSADSYAEAKNDSAAQLYAEAAQLIEKSRPEKAAELYEKSGDIRNKNNHLLQAYEAYSKAAELIRNSNPEKAAELYEKSADAHVKLKIYDAAFEQYSEAVVLDPKLSGRIAGKKIFSAILSGRWESIAKEIEEKYPSLHALLPETDEHCAAFLKDSGVSMDPERIEFAIRAFLEVKKEVGFINVRMREDLLFLSKGFAQFEKNGFRKIEGIPSWFLLQAYAATGGNPEKAAHIRKICESKEFRNSKDRRKEISWLLADHADEKRYMAELYHIVNLSSSKKIFQNITSFKLLKAIDSMLQIDEIKTQGEFDSEFEKEVHDFIQNRTESKKVVETFLKKLESLYSSGFLIAITTTYSQYLRYAGLDKLMDLALISTVMGDFEKVKFPTEEGIAGMDYLSAEQKETLMKATGQLSNLGASRQKWIERIEIAKVSGQGEVTIEMARKDLAQRIEDMKFHFKEHISTREGELEKEFAFTPKFLERIQADIKTIEGRGENKSPEYIKLKNIERILVSISELEKVDPLNAREMGPELKSLLRGLGQSTTTLFKNSYKMKPEDIDSLQAKMDVDLLSKMLIEEKEKLKIDKLVAYDSADPIHLILAGKQPENSGSCQRYDGTPNLMAGLSGYLLNAHTKIIRVENQDGIVVGRAMLKAVTADGEPALFLERAYYRNAASNPEVDEMIVRLAKQKADSLGIPLLSTWRSSGKSKQARVIVEAGLSQYEYSDGLGGGAHGNVSEGGRDIKLQVSIL